MNLSVECRNTDQSISFNSGGAYFLKNDCFSLMVSCFPLGLNGRGGHNHIDMASFTLSIKGFPTVVDLGTYTYTRNFYERNRFRDISAHNCIIPNSKTGIETNKKKVFGLQKIFILNSLKITKNSIYLIYKNQFTNVCFNRFFKIKGNELIIHDKCYEIFTSQIHFHPKKVIFQNNNYLFKSDNFAVVTNENANIENYEYSIHYGKVINSKKLVIKNRKEIKSVFRLF